MQPPAILKPSAAVVGVSHVSYRLEKQESALLLHIVWQVSDDVLHSQWLPIHELQTGLRFVRQRVRRSCFAFAWQHVPRHPLLLPDRHGIEVRVGKCGQQVRQNSAACIDSVSVHCLPA